MKKQQWKKEEVDFLKKNYPDFGVTYCSLQLNRGKDSIKKKAKRLNLKVKQKTDRYNEKSFSKIVKSSRSYSDVVRRIGLYVGHGNRQTSKKYIEKYKLNISHFDFKGEEKKHRTGIKTPLKEILIENSSYTYTSKLKEKLYKEGIRERKCVLCGQGEIWLGKKISLILDHINGINNDNRIENLRIVCPNCNATLDTFCNKNNTYKKTVNKNYCICGKLKDKKAKVCLDCYEKQKCRKIKKPPYEQLLKEVKDNNYCATGRKYEVSDNTIRKWIKKYKEELN